jgi:putative intracellular protease/amidase
MRILIILNAGTDPQASVVPEFDGLIEAYYLFSDAGMEVVVASPDGGSAAAGSDRDATGNTQAIRRFKADRKARDVINDLLGLASVCAEDFDAAFCLGPGRFDGSLDTENRAGVLVAQLLAAAKPVAVIAPAPAFVPLDAGDGLLIIGKSIDAPRRAATALLGVLGALRPAE